jgi:hypothetical protein
MANDHNGIWIQGKFNGDADTVCGVNMYNIYIRQEGRIRRMEGKKSLFCVSNYAPRKHTDEEMIQVLQVLRLGTCRYEREVINEIIDMIAEREGNPNGN